VPYYLKRRAELPAASAAALSTVLGFPRGGNPAAVKVAEAEQALGGGGIELDLDNLKRMRRHSPPRIRVKSPEACARWTPRCGCSPSPWRGPARRKRRRCRKSANGG
jgi:hypothetical protein